MLARAPLTEGHCHEAHYAVHETSILPYDRDTYKDNIPLLRQSIFTWFPRLGSVSASTVGAKNMASSSGFKVMYKNWHGELGAARGLECVRGGRGQYGEGTAVAFLEAHRSSGRGAYPVLNVDAPCPLPMPITSTSATNYDYLPRYTPPPPPNEKIASLQTKNSGRKKGQLIHDGSTGERPGSNQAQAARSLWPVRRDTPGLCRKGRNSRCAAAEGQDRRRRTIDRTARRVSAVEPGLERAFPKDHTSSAR
ncbi:hypothetical protein M7I_1068 [Glarea lozoyensis 74030]|uniref:Uncharacterized protein n=1 Tax=Glarea lozoyensis (strain ATCC 74030 / MF5533) TaxID=1104152 RepID=H0EF30_GLAL7|nr:hypothetical protein M7I_1068 [Glarea lozoyensis 74030]